MAVCGVEASRYTYHVQSKYQPAIGLSLFESTDNNEFINTYRSSLVHVKPLERCPQLVQVGSRETQPNC